MEKQFDEINEALTEDVIQQIEEYGEAENIPALRKLLEGMNGPDAARAIDYLEPDMQIKVFLSFPKAAAANIFTYVDSDLRMHIVESVAHADPAMKQNFQAIFNDLATDDAVDFLDELPANLVEALLQNVAPERRAQLNTILNYPPNSAGSLMTTEYIMLGEQMTVRQALAQIRRQGKSKETIYNCYAVSHGRIIAGAVSLRKIILSPEDSLIGDIMTSPVIYAHTLDDQEIIAEKFKEYDLLAMPVVDKEDRIVGIITIDDIVDVIEAENTEDFEKMAALRPSDDEYLKTGVATLARNRILWLMVMMISATFTGWIITHFESILASQVILASFIPMLMDTGGNCGAQVSTLVIRGMAVGEIELEQWYLVVWKEIRVGLAVAAALCIVNCLRMLLLLKDVSPRVSLVVNVTLFITVTFAKIIGCLLPMAAKSFRLDPALMASPMITTIVDAFALGTYFLVAQQILHLA